jgi:hypothetical protein
MEDFDKPANEPFALLRVSLAEKLTVQLKPLLESLKTGGSLYYNGKGLKEEDTPLSVQMTGDAKIMLVVSGSVGKVEPIMWMRTKRTSVEWDDYTNLSESCWDALRFRAKKNCYFCGIGMIKNYDGAEFVLEIKYRVFDGEDDSIEPTTIEVDSNTSPVNEERMHWFDVQQYG